MEYIDIVNEEAKLKERLRACEEKYALDVLSMTTRLEELSKHKEDFQKGNSSLAFAREYIDVDNPFTILQYFPLYIDSLKRELMRDYKQLLTHDLEIQDNAYGGDYHKYTTLVKKGYGTNYHPNLGSINFSNKMPVQYFSDLMMELEKFPVIKHIAREKLRYGNIYFDPFYGFNGLNDTLEFKIKTEEYDYTDLLKLLNFPEEFSFSANYGNDKGMYKLIGDSYVFHKLDKYSNQWYNVVESLEKFKKKNWR
jgi:hypothetical protein